MSNEGDAKTSFDGWQQRVLLSEALSTVGEECVMCGGTGGWPGIMKFVICQPCAGSGRRSSPLPS